MKNVKELPLVIVKKPITYTQIAKSETAYIYECRHEKQGENENPYYEVIKRKISPVCIDFDKRIYSDTEFKETYPKAEHFGKTGWCIWNKERAFERLKELSIVEDKK